VNKNLSTIVLYSISLSLLLLAFFYNGSPILFPDDAYYLCCAHDFIPPIWRPIFYSLYIKLTTINFSLSSSAVPISQSLITVFLLTETLAAFAVSRLSHILFILIAVVLGTGITIFVGSIQPDIFTPMLCLSAFLLCFQWSNLSLPKRIVISGIFILSNIVHLSHIAFTASLTICLWFVAMFDHAPGFFKSKTGLRAATLLLIVSVFTILCGNRLLTYHFYISKTGHAFLINRIAKDQILYKLLSEHCHEARYRLCDYQDFFLNYTGDDYLWSDNRPSPMDALGGWKKTRDESYQILIDSIKYYPVEHMVAAIKQTANQFLPIKINDIGFPIPEKDGSYAPIQKCLGLSTEEFRYSRQQMGNLIKIINFMSPFWLLSQSMSVFYIAIFIFSSSRLKRENDTLVGFSAFLLLSLIINAAICGILSGAAPRYQNRLIWLAALVPLSLIVKSLSRRKTI
jgi:hypothetical protein